MASTYGLRAIPWGFLDHALVKMWVWRTDHFDARVMADVNSFSWEILDLIRAVDGEGKFLAEGRAGDFAEAERAIRETIGKSYPTKYGYSGYAGALATTFTIATGESMDFAAFNGIRSIVTVKMPNGQEQSFVGETRVVHYELHLTALTGQTVKIQPAHILRVVPEGGGRARATAASTYTGMGRMYRGTVVPGCSGKPGFMPDTIDHTGEKCSVHEYR